MFNENTISIIKSTAPILEKSGEILTQHFYKRMFLKNPEVISLFNFANQAKKIQQKALAAAICAYAKNIDNLGALGSAVELIAQKHASLQIKPEHYLIVGEHLLGSIQEVLGIAENDPIVKAWAEAYDFLANILINREKQIYNDQFTKTGGWKGFKQFRIIKKEAENDFITSFYLAPIDGQILPEFKAGQYITIRIPTLGNSTTMRNYSLSHPSHKEWFRISVKRELGEDLNTPNGYVSNFMHSKIEVGSTIEVGSPCGEFFLEPFEENIRPLVLLAGGIGITPILCMLKSTVNSMSKRPIIFVYGILDEKSRVFKQELDELSIKNPNLKIHYRYSNKKAENITSTESRSLGFVDEEFIKSIVPNSDCDYYFCGPKIFMINIYKTLKSWDVPKSQIHFEFFGPREELEN